MSHTRTQRHTKLAQYVIQPKNTVRSRHFAPRMRVSKGIKDSKASFARGAQNGQPRSSFFLYLSFSFSVLAILSLSRSSSSSFSVSVSVSVSVSLFTRCLLLRSLLPCPSVSLFVRERSHRERAPKTRRFEHERRARACCARYARPTRQKNWKSVQIVVQCAAEALVNARRPASLYFV